jgi:predicted RNase H-like HicB family nuclease
MKLKIVIHDAKDGGYWAEVPATPGCATQGETLDELLANVHEAIQGCLSVDVQPVKKTRKNRVIEIVV